MLSLLGLLLVWWGIPSVAYIIYALLFVDLKLFACLTCSSLRVCMACLLASSGDDCRRRATSHLKCKPNMWSPSVQFQTASSPATSWNEVEEKACPCLVGQVRFVDILSIIANDSNAKSSNLYQVINKYSLLWKCGGWTVALCLCLFVYAQFSATTGDRKLSTNNEKSERSSWNWNWAIAGD